MWPLNHFSLCDLKPIHTIYRITYLNNLPKTQEILQKQIKQFNWFSKIKLKIKQFNCFCFYFFGYLNFESTAITFGKELNLKKLTSVLPQNFSSIKGWFVSFFQDAFISLLHVVLATWFFRIQFNVNLSHVCLYFLFPT